MPVFAPDLQHDASPGATSATTRSSATSGSTPSPRGSRGPDLDTPEPVDAEPPERLPLSKLGAVVFAGGFRPDYESWVDCPGGFDELGFPLHRDGASTAVPGLHFAGVHFLRKRKSSLLIGVGEDAQIVAGQIAKS